MNRQERHGHIMAKRMIETGFTEEDVKIEGSLRPKVPKGLHRTDKSKGEPKNIY